MSSIKRKKGAINGKVLLVSSEMGLGHLRANLPYAEYFKAKIIIHGQSQYATPWVRFMWGMGLSFYSWLSRYSNIPILGNPLRLLLNSLLRIPPLSKSPSQQEPTFPLWLVEQAISLGACNELENLHKYQQVITTFYPAVTYYAARRPWVDVFCQICDSDLSRVWVPRDPQAPNIHYFATCKRTIKRLRSYGVPRRKITLTGFPFPHELVGGEREPIARENYHRRREKLRALSAGSISKGPLNILYSIGGAGALVDTGAEATRSLEPYIKRGIITVTLIAPPNSKSLGKLLSFKSKYFPNNNNVRVPITNSHQEYFDEFTRVIRTTDVLWSKPGELSFYSALGIPVIMAPPIGPQEVANRKWVLEREVAIDQGKPSYTSEWLIRLLFSGTLERIARNGWRRGVRTGLYSAASVIHRFSQERKVEKATQEAELMLQE